MENTTNSKSNNQNSPIVELDPKTIEIIKSTAPVLAEHGEAIAVRLYELLLSSEPELTQFFNPSNQSSGKQAKALANAVYAVAANIDNLAPLESAVVQIAHKHRSLQIQPEHYPIVGENLLLAIQQILRIEPTSEVITAWAKAYEFIANIFIDLEARMYKEAESQPGGWSGFKDFKVIKKEKESSVITSFYLQPSDGGPITNYFPGQYLTVKIRRPQDSYAQIRHYSISDAPGKDYYRISVKREESFGESGGVSAYLHDHLEEGGTISLAAPAGTFTLDLSSSRPLVLISGGVGLTPLVSMLNATVELQPNRPIIFIQAALNGTVHAMKDYITSMTKTYPHVKSFVCYEKPTELDYLEKNFHQEGFINAKWLEEILEELNSDFYFCGPTAFMSTINSILNELKIPQAQRQFEFFGPMQNI